MKDVKRTIDSVKVMNVDFTVTSSSRPLKIIPYVGCKSGFASIFDKLIPNDYGKKIYDVFGGGGGFTFYACNRFGSKNVIFNDHNPVIVNLMKALQANPLGLYDQYQKHYKKSSVEYYAKVRKMSIDDGLEDAGRFFYLAKNAFSGKIRFNSRNEFNCPPRKNSKCPQTDSERLVRLSEIIKHLKILNNDFSRFTNKCDSFIYLDPPYMNNQNGHYNAIIPLDDFVDFVQDIQDQNKVMISEQNSPDELKLGRGYSVYDITLKRSLQYNTKTKSSEIIAINYNV